MIFLFNMIFQIFSQNKYKRKRENRCHVTLKLLKGGHTNGFGSSKNLNNWFCDLGRKSGFGPKLREAEMTFFLNFSPSILALASSQTCPVV
jgi:hypothetical protein